MEKYNAALANAKEILKKAEAGDESVTQSQVDMAWKELLKVLEYMEFKKGDKTELQELVKIAEELELDVYITEGKEEFKTALQEAKDVIANGDAIQQDVEDAYKQLLSAMNQLVKKGDKTNLNKVIELAEEKAEKLDQYMEAGKQAFLDALDEAKKVRDNEDAVQEQVNEAWNNLLTKMSELKLIPNKDALEELIHCVQDMDISIYTQNSQDRITTALREALSVYENTEASQEEVDAAVERLQTAVEQAEKQPEENSNHEQSNQSGNSQGSQQDNQSTSGQNIQKDNQDDKNSANTSQKSVKTGDRAYIAMFVFGIVIAAGVVIIELTKRRREK